MIFWVRLYAHHDNDLIQLYLNGVRMSSLFEQALSSHFYHESIQFILPSEVEFKAHKGKTYRIKVCLDDEKQKDLIQWICAFPDQYKCHCIKNIARLYLGSSMINLMNQMYMEGTWKNVSQFHTVPEGTKPIRLPLLKKRVFIGKIEENWIDQVSENKIGRKMESDEAEKAWEGIYNTPTEEILGRQPPAKESASIKQVLTQTNADIPSPQIENPTETDELAGNLGGEIDDFDAFFAFEMMRDR